MRVGVIGVGLIGQKRISSLSKDDSLIGCFDLNKEKSEHVASKFDTNCFTSSDELIKAVGPGGLIIVATLHDSLVPESLKALKFGCHVLVEKPGARNDHEFKKLAELAKINNVTLRIGFNHRFHPSIQKLKEIQNEGNYGSVQLVRARYGHGGRVGYEKEWRSIKEISGGGELLDQGSHLLDLVQFIFGDFEIEYSSLENLYWNMEVEDNAFIAGKIKNYEAKFWLHASWTEWKNLFSFEVFYKTAKVEITGLGGSYGPESIAIYHMESGLGPPKVTTIQFPPSTNPGR